MPKTAATMTGLLLAACSIGFNTIRYPIVSEMVGPALAYAPSGEPLPPAPAAPPMQPEPPSPASAPSNSAAGNPPAAQAEVQPVPDVAGAIADAALPAAELADSAAAARDDGAATASTSPEKPLAPVSLAAVSGPAAAADPSGAVRRLPPVDLSPPAAGRDWQPTGGSIPVYPSTGIK
jgi:hypothetical protein